MTLNDQSTVPCLDLCRVTRHDSNTQHSGYRKLPPYIEMFMFGLATHFAIIFIIFQYQNYFREKSSTVTKLNTEDLGRNFKT